MVEDFIKRYDVTGAIFNLYAWVHVCKDVRIYDSLDASSAPPLESRAKIRQYITNRNTIAQHAFRHRAGRPAAASLQASVRLKYDSLPCQVAKGCVRGEITQLKNNMCRNNSRNSSILVRSTPAAVDEFGDNHVYCRAFAPREFFQRSITLFHLEFWLCHQLSDANAKRCRRYPT